MSSQSVGATRRHHATAALRALGTPARVDIDRGRRQVLTVLLLLFALALFAVITWTPLEVSWSSLLPLIVISGVMHRPGEHATVVIVVFAALVAGGFLVPEERHTVVGALVAGSIIAAVTMWRSRARARVGVNGTSGELLLDELRCSLERRSVLPDLPRGWHVEGAVTSAYGHPFSGDFIVSWLSDDATRFEAVLVDVSGKGLQSASRAVTLSGALEALLGAVPPEDFLAAANDYVGRQRWAEGYATAVHVAVDLVTGEFRVWRAGHPPAASFTCASNSWTVLEDGAGPALGLIDTPVYRCDSGVLGGHDAVLLYSDGLVERHGRSLDDGIARLLGQAEAAILNGFTGGPGALCAAAPAGHTDDRSVVLLWRSA